MSSTARAVFLSSFAPTAYALHASARAISGSGNRRSRGSRIARGAIAGIVVAVVVVVLLCLLCACLLMRRRRRRFASPPVGPEMVPVGTGPSSGYTGVNGGNAGMSQPGASAGYRSGTSSGHAAGMGTSGAGPGNHDMTMPEPAYNGVAAGGFGDKHHHYNAPSGPPPYQPT